MNKIKTSAATLASLTTLALLSACSGGSSSVPDVVTTTRPPASEFVFDTTSSDSPPCQSPGCDPGRPLVHRGDEMHRLDFTQPA